MDEKPIKNLVRPLLPFCFAALLLVVLLCGLSRAIEAEPGVSSAAASRESERAGLLNYLAGVSVCEQTQNRVPDPGFDQGIGRPTHWHGEGECKFQANQPGHDGYPSAVIFDQPGEDECRLVTPVGEIYVEPNRWYDYRAWLKTGPLDGNAFLRVRFYKWQDGWEAIHPYAYTNAVTDTGGVWVRVTGSAQAPPDAGYARVEAVLPALSAGSVWVDDVFFGLATCLEISKYDEPDPVWPGEMLTYTIVYSNTGREKATDVEIIETYDRDVDFESAQPPPDKGNTKWEVPVLPPGASGTITVLVQVEDDAEGPSIVNCVDLDSDETVERVDICISTQVDGDGCGLAVYPPKAEKTVAPGGVANYDLTLYNTGSCDGQVNLTAISSQGWGVKFAPPPPYTLPQDDSQHVTVGITVPLAARGGDSDVAFITATLVCGMPCNKTVTATATVTTTVAVPPTAAKIHGPQTGRVDTAYTFTATVSPPTATCPVYTWLPSPTAGQGSAVVTYKWSTFGTKIITVTAANAGGTVSSTHSISIWHMVHLPLVLRCYPPPVGPPALHSIDNSDIDGNYDVCWSYPCFATYVLEEATDSAFSDAKEIYRGTKTCYRISDKSAGWYYYRVEASGSGVCRGWSNTEEVGAWWEQEDEWGEGEDDDWNDYNDSRSTANGPLISGKDYYGYPDDKYDFFKIYLATKGQIAMEVDRHTGTCVNLHLYYESESDHVCRDTQPPFEKTCGVDKPGWYYIRIRTDQGYNMDTPYTLRATFP
jgi:uncharacterized repeat protein (TIGR01451 family)